MLARGVPSKLFRLIRQCYAGKISLVRTDNEESCPLKPNPGILLGCLLSQVVFIVADMWIMQGDLELINEYVWEICPEINIVRTKIFVTPSNNSTQALQLNRQRVEVVSDSFRLHYPAKNGQAAYSVNPPIDVFRKTFA